MIAPSFRTSLILLAGLSLSGCSLAGVRAQSDACPAGQTCSDEAPSGLFFLGATFSDALLMSASGVAPVAVGGTETVTALTGASNGSPAFTGGFSASSTDPSRLAIGTVSPPTVVIRGEAAGAAELQLFQVGTAELLDEVALSVASLATVTLVPAELVLPLNVMTTSTPPPTWALLAGSAVPVIVRLEDAGMNRLVDETTAIRSASGALTSTAWDLFGVPVPAAAGPASFAIQAGGASFPVTAPVVAAIDDILLLTFDGTSGSPQQLGSGTLPFCLVAESGGDLVAGATWTFTASANLGVSGEDTVVAPSCLMLKGIASGAATLEVTASGFSKTFSFTVDTSKAMRQPHRTLQRPAARPAAGSRAAWAARE